MKYKLLTITSIVIFSSLLWIFVSLSHDYSTMIKVPVRIVNIPEGYTATNISNEEITLNLKGEGWQLAQLTFGLQERVDIPFSEGSNKQSISVRNALEQNSWISSSVQVILVEPEKVSYSVERINYKIVKINSKAILQYKTGYGLVSDISVFPDTVRISGPRSIINELDTVYTEEVLISGIDKEQTVEIKLAAMPDINFEYDKVNISFDVQKIVDKTFENIKVERRGVPPSRELSLFPESVKVILRGGINTLGRLEDSQIKLYINFRQALEDTIGSIEPRVEIPPFTTLIDVRPKRLDYIIKQF